jgi:uncharacterized peroxidase-related enzyme
LIIARNARIRINPAGTVFLPIASPRFELTPQELDMARIKPAQPNAETQDTLNAVKQKLGMVPNLFSTFAHAPAVLHSYLAFSDAIGKGRLSAGEREVVALAVAQSNSCAYCLAAHTAIGKGAGLSDADVDAARRTGGTPRNSALAALAKQLTNNRGRVSDADFAQFKATGFSDGDVLEVVALVALNTLTNYVNHVADTDVDFPKVSV